MTLCCGAAAYCVQGINIICIPCFACTDGRAYCRPYHSYNNYTLLASEKQHFFDIFNKKLNFSYTPIMIKS